MQRSTNTEQKLDRIELPICICIYNIFDSRITKLCLFLCLIALLFLLQCETWRRCPPRAHGALCAARDVGRNRRKNAILAQIISVAMPADSRCEKKFEIVLGIAFEIADAKLWESAGDKLLGNWAGLKHFGDVSGRLARTLKSTQIRRVPKSEFFECTFGPLSSHPFSLIFPPSFPFRPCSLSHHSSPLHTSLFIPPFLSPGKLRFRYPSDLGTL